MIQPGALGADYSFSRPAPVDLASQGVRFVCRYLSPAPNPKILTPAERDALHAAGIGIVLNWEWYANRPGEGPGAGAADANQAVAQAKDLGYPRGSVIVFSVDFDPTNSQVPNVLAYLQAAESVCLASGYRAGTYGPYSIFDKLVAQRIAVSLLWQPYAWAPRGVGDQDRVQHPSAHVFQRYGLVELTLPGIDENLALKPFDVWLPDTPIGDLVADFTCTIDGNSYAVSPGGVMPITPRMLSAYASTPNIGDVSVDDEQGTKARILFFLAHGRWQDANGNDPGPREAKGTSVVTGPSASDIAKAVNDDAARRMLA